MVERKVLGLKRFDLKGVLFRPLQATPGSIVTWADMGDPAAEPLGRRLQNKSRDKSSFSQMPSPA